MSHPQSIPEVPEPSKVSEPDRELLQAGLLNGSINHVAHLNEIELEDTTSVPSTTGEVVHRIPINGDSSDTDYLLVTTDEDSIRRVAETHIEQLTEESARLRVWVDGRQEFDGIVTDPPRTTSTRGVRDAWSAFNNCLNNAGVPMAVVTAISIACGMLGAFTAGTGVPACMIGAAGSFSFTVSFCYGKALKSL